MWSGQSVSIFLCGQALKADTLGEGSGEGLRNAFGNVSGEEPREAMGFQAALGRESATNRAGGEWGVAAVGGGVGQLETALQ